MKMCLLDLQFKIIRGSDEQERMWAYGIEQKTLDGKQELIKYLL